MAKPYNLERIMERKIILVDFKQKTIEQSITLNKHGNVPKSHFYYDLIDVMIQTQEVKQFDFEAVKKHKLYCLAGKKAA